VDHVPYTREDGQCASSHLLMQPAGVISGINAGVISGINDGVRITCDDRKQHPQP
jgi:hypothetical protein